MTNSEFPVFRTERLLLRQFQNTDLENVFHGLSDPVVNKYYGVSFENLEDAREQLKFFKELETNGTGIWWAVCSPGNETFYGAIGLNNLIPSHKKAEIGFWLLKDFWGKGFVMESIPLVCSYAFDTLKLHRIEALVESENSNSKRVLSKMNFRYEGTMKDCEIKNGKVISLEIYAKLQVD